MLVIPQDKSHPLLVIPLKGSQRGILESLEDTEYFDNLQLLEAIERRPLKIGIYPET